MNMSGQILLFLFCLSSSTFAGDLTLDFKNNFSVKSTKLSIKDDPNSLESIQKKKMVFETYRKAITFLGQNPEQIDNLLGSSRYLSLKSKFDSTTCDNTIKELALSSGLVPSKKIRLNPATSGLYEIGLALEQNENPTALSTHYTFSLGVVPQFDKHLFVSTQKFEESSIATKQELLEQLEDYLSEYRDELATKAEEISQSSDSSSNNKNCSSETGYVVPRGDGETSDWCLDSSFSSRGLYINNEFPLKNNLTCIKNQGNRGTCQAQAIAAAMETLLYQTKGVPYNLSEQYIYFLGEAIYQRDKRYEYGLDATLSKDLKKDNVMIPLESAWNYNLSWDMTSLNDKNKYPFSCTDYFGVLCSNYAFQTEETKVGLTWTYTVPDLKGLVRPGQFRDVDSFLNPLRINHSLDKAIVFVANDIPVIVGVQATRALTLDDKAGYVEYKTKYEAEVLDKAEGQIDPATGALPEYVLGGHAMLIVDFVKNSELPRGVTPADEEGYFIVKNSWGLTGDCGFYYISYKYMRKHVTSLVALY